MPRSALTIGEIERAKWLRSQGLLWAEISDTLGTASSGSIRQIVSKYNLYGPGVRYQPKFNVEDLIRRYAAGESLTEMAAAEGISISGLTMRLTRAGFDKEERRKCRNGFKKHSPIVTLLDPSS